MLNFFPVMYEDELLISAIARYRNRCGYRNIRSLNLDIYGKKVITKSALLPMNIGDFVEQISPITKLTTSNLINKHTLFPFYTAYLSSEKMTQVYNHMKNGEGASVESMLGLSSFSMKPTKYLKYCTECYGEDIHTIGESFWRRLHQVPGVFYCTKHHKPLEYSTSLIINGVNDYKMVSEALSDSRPLEKHSVKIKEMNLTYTKNAEILLNSYFDRKENSFINSFYIDRLREKDLTSQNGYINSINFAHSFLNYYSHDYLILMKSEINVDAQKNWLRTFFLDKRSNKSPLRHLLLHDFLELDVKELFRTSEVTGRKESIKKVREPKFSIIDRREKWLQLLRENPSKGRGELKKIGKGLHTWLRAHDLEWYEIVTPKVKVRKKRKDSINYPKRDEECLKLVQLGYEHLLSKKGKPVRITQSAIQREMGLNRWVESKKLEKTRAFLNEARESIEDFRLRKIKWAISEMSKRNMEISPYKVERFIGFDTGEQVIRELVLEQISGFNKVDSSER